VSKRAPDWVRLASVTLKSTGTWSLPESLKGAVPFMPLGPSFSQTASFIVMLMTRFEGIVLLCAALVFAAFVHDTATVWRALH
jgi:hypothetical protein